MPTQLQQSTISAGSTPSSVTYYETRDFQRSLNKAMMTGGKAQKRHDRVRVVLGSLNTDDPFKALGVTNHGETRIRNCVKYDLGDGWRLVTRQTKKFVLFLFVGDHDDTDRWLDAHRGEDFGVKDGRLIRVPGVGEHDAIERDHLADHHDTPLVELLDDADTDHLLDGLPARLTSKLCNLNRGSTPEQMEQLVAQITDPDRAEFVRRVFVLLHAGNVDGARAHVGLSRGIIAPVDELSHQEMMEVEDGEEIRQLRVGSPEYETWLRDFEKRTSWYDWFLFLHPAQEKVVRADYSGVAQLSGVSGSGKTCVAVRRAMRLAASSEARVLVLTLNRSLAGLLNQLVDAACADEQARSRISVISFFELAQEILASLERESVRRYNDETWKLSEHVDEIFREYYRQWSNNHDADVLSSIHRSLTARGINGESYVREEFDWIRSAVKPSERQLYLGLERRGRKVPVSPDWRRDLLRGLDGWERKMAAVGVTDYLGLTVALARHIERITPQFTNILVDEAQDFGTTELDVVRRLVPPGPNDIFLCGDIAQTILPKHRSLADASIVVSAREKIQQNYRNSREILSAAYELLKNNLHEEMFESEDLEILDPRFANFSGPVPMALAAGSLEEEIAYARSYAATRLGADARSICIAFAGYSTRDIGRFAERLGLPALNGAYDARSAPLVLSDLEQTKGYEFDTLIIVNCSAGVLPARDAPEEEQFRDTCKLYVAMTRARKELILSFSQAASPWIQAVSGSIAAERWSSVETFGPDLLCGVPPVLSDFDSDRFSDGISELDGMQYTYTSLALGLSSEAQMKMIELVDGAGARAAGTRRRLRWRCVGDLASDLRSSRQHDGLFGPVVAEEIRQNLAWAATSD